MQSSSSAARPGALAADFAAQMVDVAPGQIWLKDEGSRRHWSVALRRYAIAQYAVTHASYAAVLGLAPPAAGDAAKPVTDVSWYDAIAFCNALSLGVGLRAPYTVDEGDQVDMDASADGYRLPTEAEWEYACRAGSIEPRYGDLDDIAWHAGNSSQRPHAIGGRQPNAWGLYDTIGNVWEWCWDVYDAQVYGEYRVFRGGGWNDGERACRASCRRKSHPTFRIDDLGFRLARTL